MSSNTASGSLEIGGCICVEQESTALVKGSILSSCSAPLGGGLGVSTLSNLTLIGGVISDCSAQPSPVFSEISAGGGGGIAISSAAFQGQGDFVIRENSGRAGGGVYIASGITSFRKGRIFQNTAVDQGAGIASISSLVQGSLLTTPCYSDAFREN